MSKLTLQPFTTDEDFAQAERIAKRQGYGKSWAYTTSSHIPGLYLLPTYNGQASKVVAKTEEMGFVVIEVIED